METRQSKCDKCGEIDYLDFTAKIDNKRYCQACYEEVMNKMESNVIKEVFIKK
jgi:formylmethanofuran dehydrogenase subunit E